MNKKKLKICFAASSGGHFEQLMMLKPLMQKYNSFVVTEQTYYRADAGADRKVYYLPQVNRREAAVLFKMVQVFFQSLVIYIREKPDAVISTGVLAMVPLCLICKIFRKKLIYIESFAKVTSPTLSGKFLYKYADQFYVQWEPMKKVFPNAIYLGGIY